MTDKLASYENCYSFLKNDDNDFTIYTDLEEISMAMYYALTTLATVGLGDLHPKSTAEMFVCGFMMISGVCLFSYVLT